MEYYQKNLEVLKSLSDKEIREIFVFVIELGVVNNENLNYFLDGYTRSANTKVGKPKK